MVFQQMHFRELNIVRLNLLSLLVIIGLLSLSMGYLFISSYYEDFIVEFDKIKNDYIYLQKEKIISQIDLGIENISMQEVQTDHFLTNELKKKTYSAYKIVTIISDMYQGQKPEQEIKGIVKNSIQAIRRESHFNCFLVNQYGHIFTLDRKQVRKTDISFLDFPDKEGLSLHKRISIKTRTQSESYFQYLVMSQDNSLNYQSVGLMFLKQIENYNWFIGFGISYNDMQMIVKKKILENLQLQTKKSNPQAAFEIYELMDDKESELRVLLDIDHPELIGSVLNVNTKDAKGRLYLKDFLKDGLADKNQFIEIWEKKTKSDPAIKKLAHFRYYPKWKWLITKGFYPENFEELNIQNKIDVLQQNIMDKLLYIAILFLFFISIAILISIAFSRRIGTMFNAYKEKVEDRSR